MKKKILDFAKYAAVFAFALAMVINLSSNLPKQFNLSEAYADQTGGSTDGSTNGNTDGSTDGATTTKAYRRSTGPCTYKLSGKTGVKVKLFGLEYTIPASGELTVTIEKGEVICKINGDTLCTPKDCAPSSPN